MQERPKDRENAAGHDGEALLARPLIPGVVARRKEAKNGDRYWTCVRAWQPRMVYGQPVGRLSFSRPILIVVGLILIIIENPKACPSRYHLI